MFKLIEPANQIVYKKIKQNNLNSSKNSNSIESSFVNDQNYDAYCILVYDFFKINSEEIKETNQLQTYIERGEGKE